MNEAVMRVGRGPTIELVPESDWWSAVQRHMPAAALAELERRLFFLVRNRAGEVSWAFPVTAEVTPHQLTFPSGDRRYGA